MRLKFVSDLSRMPKFVRRIRLLRVTGDENVLSAYIISVRVSGNVPQPRNFPVGCKYGCLDISGKICK